MTRRSRARVNTTLNRRLGAGLLGLALLDCALLVATPSRADPSTDARFKAIYTREWTWRQTQHLDQDEDDHGVHPDLPHVDAASQQARLTYWRDVLRQLAGVDPKSLSPEQQINYSVYRAQIQTLGDDQLFREYEKPLNSDSSFWSSEAEVGEEDFPSKTQYVDYLSQLRDLPRYFSEEIDNMRAGMARGFTAPKVTLVGRDSAIASVAEAKRPEDTVYYKPFEKMPASISPQDQAELRAQAIALIRGSVIPAYGRLLAFFRTQYLPHAQEALAAESLPDGQAYYRAQIRKFTTLDMSPNDIHQLGLAEMARIHAEMIATMRQSGFTGDLPAFLKFLRTDPRFYAKTPDELLKDAAWIAKQFDGVASQYFGYLPRSRFAIRPVPADEAPFYTSGRGGPGVYLVNTYDLPARPLYSLPALTLHESAPGHAFQIPIAEEHKDLPPFRRLYISAYGEGWALYCEHLGQEMGIYQTPYETFGMLSYQAWRAARLVVDTGIHAQGWTRAQAQQYLRDNTALSDHEIETEVDRYIGWPGQALSYYLGELTILNARRQAQAALGERFNLRAFHDAVLETGSVPLPVLKAHIDAFIAGGGIGPYPDMEK